MKVNFRTIVFFVICMALGIFSCGLLFDLKHALIILGSLLVVATVLLSVFYRKKILLVMIIGFIVGFSAFAIELTVKLPSNNKYENVMLQGRVVEIYEDGCRLERVVLDGKKLYSDAVIHTDVELLTGNVITARVRGYSLDFDIIEGASFYNSEDVWSEFFIIGTLKIEEGKKTFFEQSKERIISLIEENLPTDDVGVLRALLLGDKEGMSYFDRKAAQTAGVSHIFAVSGLHVGFCVSILYFIFKKLRINGWISLCLLVVILTVYAGITCFSPSVIRASIMAVIAFVAGLIKRRNDSLTTLATAVGILLLIKPSNLLFSVSFLMSVAAVLGICLFYRPIYNFIINENKSAPVRFVAGSIAMSLSANSVLLPVSFYFFGGIATYTVLSNLLIIPLVTVTYSIFAIITALSLIIPQCGILYKYFGVLIYVIRTISTSISRLPYPTVGGDGGILFGIMYLISAIILSGYVVARRKIKAIAVISTFSLSIILFFAL